MISYVVAWVAAIIFVEATVEIEVNSELFVGFRSRVVKVKWIGWYLNGLFSCGYCLSVWVSAVAALFVPGDLLSISGTLSKIAPYAIPYIIADYLFKVFVIHRLANAWHELIYRWLERMPWVLAFHKPNIPTNTVDTQTFSEPAHHVEIGDQNDADNNKNDTQPV